MNVYFGNPHNERHGRDMLIYEFIAAPDMAPDEMAEAFHEVCPEIRIAAEQTEVKVFAGKKSKRERTLTQSTDVHGHINTQELLNASGQPECYHVQVALHVEDCHNPNCLHGHGYSRTQMPHKVHGGAQYELAHLEELIERIGVHESLSVNDVRQQLGLDPLPESTYYLHHFARAQGLPVSHLMNEGGVP